MRTQPTTKSGKASPCVQEPHHGVFIPFEGHDSGLDATNPPRGKGIFSEKSSFSKKSIDDSRMHHIVRPMETLKDLVRLGDNEILSTDEVCELLRISRPTLRKLANSGQLPFVKLGNKPMSHRKFLLKNVVEYVSKSLSTNQ